MSWRRFLVLYRGINPYGAVATHFDSVKKQNNEDDTSAWGALTALSRPVKPEQQDN